MLFVKCHLYVIEFGLDSLAALASKPLQRLRGLFTFPLSQQVVGWLGEKEEGDSERDGNTGRRYGEVHVFDVRTNAVLEQKPGYDQQLE